eukprot:2617229-Amphidinium_carterae.1
MVTYRQGACGPGKTRLPVCLESANRMPLYTYIVNHKCSNLMFGTTVAMVNMVTAQTSKALPIPDPKVRGLGVAVLLLQG